MPPKIKANKIKAVEFEAEVRMVRTMAGDHTINVTFNLPEYCMPQAQQIMGWVNDMVTVVVQLSGTESGGR